MELVWGFGWDRGWDWDGALAGTGGGSGLGWAGTGAGLVLGWAGLGLGLGWAGAGAGLGWDWAGGSRFYHDSRFSRRLVLQEAFLSSVQVPPYLLFRIRLLFIFFLISSFLQFLLRGHMQLFLLQCFPPPVSSLFFVFLSFFLFFSPLSSPVPPLSLVIYLFLLFLPLFLFLAVFLVIFPLILSFRPISHPQLLPLSSILPSPDHHPLSFTFQFFISPYFPSFCSLPFTFSLLSLTLSSPLHSSHPSPLFLNLPSIHLFTFAHSFSSSSSLTQIITYPPSSSHQRSTRISNTPHSSCHKWPLTSALS